MTLRPDEPITPERKPTAEEIIAKAQRQIAATREATVPSTQQRTAIFMHHAVFWLSKHWLLLFNIVVFLYTAGAFLAPVLLYFGYTDLGALVHHLYDPFCHQYPKRSWFLFGAQPYYPTGSPLLPEGVEESKLYFGDATVGYKVAFCQRDVAIYAAMFLGGLLYAAARRRWKINALSMKQYVLFGLVPMGLDGGVQLLSTIVGMLQQQVIPALRRSQSAFWNRPAEVLAVLTPAWLPNYEATPFTRTLTGALFGLASIGVMYPYLNEFFEDMKAVLSSRYRW